MLPFITVFLSGPRTAWLFGPLVFSAYLWLLFITPGDPVAARERLIGFLAVLVALTAASVSFERQRIRSRRELQRAHDVAEAARERADRASQAKSEFLANMSHVSQLRGIAYSVENSGLSVLLNIQ